MAGTKDKAAGKAMEVEGQATGDPIRQTEGKLVSKRGEEKDASSKLSKRGTASKKPRA